MQKLVDMKAQLSELATILNAFKSEAVQLRILDTVLGKQSTEKQLITPEDTEHNGKTKARRKRTTKKTDGEASAKRKKAPAGTGPVATLNDLLSGSYFDKARILNDIITHCKDKLGRPFKPNELSGPLVRMVRKGELTREKNADNTQYEYKKPS
jgi:hypothetical protein